MFGTSTAEHECPNCRSKFTQSSAAQVQETSNGGERYSLLRGEEYLDGDAIEYDAARASEETSVGVEGDADIEEKGKGTIKL